MGSGAFDRNHHGIAEVFKKCPRQLEKGRKQQDLGLPELGETELIDSYVYKSVNEHSVKAYYVPSSLLHLHTGGMMMNRTEFLSLRPSQGKADKYTGNW